MGGSYVQNTVKGKKERVGRLLEMHADNREDVEVAVAGDIVAVAGLKDTTTGDSLTAQDAPVILERMDFPDPVIKIMTDPFVGSLTFVRIYSGVLESGSYVQNTVKGNKERVVRLLEMHAVNREDVEV